MWTELPASASCSPHIAPEGPPPTMTYSAINYSHKSLHLSPARNVLEASSGGQRFQDKGKTTRQNPASSIAPKTAAAAGEPVMRRTSCSPRLINKKNKEK